MTINQQLQQILKLSVKDRLHLIGQIWDSLKSETKEQSISLSEAQEIELSRRSELLHHGSAKTYSLEEMKALKLTR